MAASIGWDATVNKSFIILPLGISFYTFQGISYLIDVYRKSQKPEYNYIYFQSYIAFFPQLVAGPIERAGNILPQLYKKTRFDWNSLGVGITYILWGLFKKMALADNLALLVDKVFSDPQSYTSFELLVAAYSFAFQIYFDFSAYSQIAIGSARLMGINLSKNFNLPYFAINPIDFWRRWHITLSKWLRDYIYIPLGGSRKSNQRTYLNLLFTMLLAGLWHGSNWTFVIWGGYHGILLAINHFIKRFYAEDKKKDNSLITIIKIIVTFNLVCIGWIFFRAKSISDAIYFIQGIIAFSGWYITPTMAPYLVLLIGIISVNILYYFFENKLNAIEYNRKTTAVTIFILIVALAIQANSMGTKFIYFEF